MKNGNFLNYFCESRKTLSFYSKNLLNDELTANEKELLLEVIEDAQKITNKIYAHCKIHGY